MTNEPTKQENLITSAAERVSKKTDLSPEVIQKSILKELQKLNATNKSTNKTIEQLFSLFKEDVIPKIVNPVIAEEVASTATSSATPASGPLAAPGVLPSKTELEEIDKPKKVEVVNFEDLAKLLPEAFVKAFKGLALEAGKKESKSPNGAPAAEGGLSNPSNWGLAGGAYQLLKRALPTIIETLGGTVAGAGVGATAGVVVGGLALGTLGGYALRPVQKMAFNAMDDLYSAADDKVNNSNLPVKLGKETVDREVDSLKAKKRPNGEDATLGKSSFIVKQYIENAKKKGATEEQIKSVVEYAEKKLGKEIFTTKEEVPQSVLDARERKGKKSTTQPEEKPAPSEVPPSPATKEQKVPKITPDAVKKEVADIPTAEKDPTLLPEPIESPSFKRLREANSSQSTSSVRATPDIVPEPVKKLATPAQQVAANTQEKQQTIEEWTKKGYAKTADIPSTEWQEFVKKHRSKDFSEPYAEKILQQHVELMLSSKAAKPKTGSDSSVVEKGGRETTPAKPTTESVISQDSTTTTTSSQSTSSISATPDIVPEPVKKLATPVESPASTSTSPSPARQVVANAQEKQQTIEEWAKKGYFSTADIPPQEWQEFVKKHRSKALPEQYAIDALRKHTDITLRAKAAKTKTGSDSNVVEKGGREVTPETGSSEPTTNTVVSRDLAANSSQSTSSVRATPDIVPEPVKKLATPVESPNSTTSTPTSPAQQVVANAQEKQQTIEEWAKKGYFSTVDIPPQEWQEFARKHRSKALPEQYAVDALRKHTDITLRAKAAKTKTGSDSNIVEKGGKEVTPEPIKEAVAPKAEAPAPAITPEPIKEAVAPKAEAPAPAITPEPIKEAVAPKAESTSTSKKYPDSGAKSQDFVKEVLEWSKGQPKGQMFIHGTVDAGDLHEALTKFTESEKRVVNVTARQLNNWAADKILIKQAEKYINDKQNKKTGDSSSPIKEQPNDLKQATAEISPEASKQATAEISPEASKQELTTDFNKTGLLKPPAKIIPKDYYGDLGSIKNITKIPTEEKEISKSKIDISNSSTNKTDVILERIANNTGSADENIKGLIQGFNNLAKVLEKTTGEKMPLVIPSNNSKQKTPTMVDYLPSSSPIQNFRANTVERSRFQPV
jgi:hypothetical protein